MSIENIQVPTNDFKKSIKEVEEEDSKLYDDSIAVDFYQNKELIKRNSSLGLQQNDIELANRSPIKDDTLILTNHSINQD